MTRRVDIIVPCYRYAHYLRQCVASVLRQSHADLRVLIIDDCSPDHTPDVAWELVACDRRVSYRRHVANRGHIATYNEGLDWADGHYTLLISADDVLAPGALERAVRVMDADPSLGMSYGRVINFDGDPPCMAEASSQDFPVSRMEYLEFLARSCALGSTAIRAPTVIVRTELQRRLGSYVQELPHSADTEMWLRFAAHAPVVFIDAVQALKRKHGANMQFTFSPAYTLDQQKAAFDLHFRQFGDRLPELDSLRQRVAKTIGEFAFWNAHQAFEAQDMTNYREYMRLAAELYPPVRSWKYWRRLRLKEAIGPRGWARIRWALDRLAAPRREAYFVR